MATHNLLDKNIPVYHRFVDNQVLTNDQLNQVIDHINYQDKQTRASLIGVGHMCGMRITKNGNNFTISGGVAVTSDGDLLKIKETEFTGYKKFNDERVKYSHFRDGESILDLYELKEDSEPSNVKPLAAFDADTGIADNDKVFIVYLECFAKEEEDCSPLECNAQGEEVVRNIKVLITSYENAQKIAAKDSIFSSFLNAGNDNVAVNIPTVYVRRIVINAASGASINTLKNAYAINFNELSNAITTIGGITLFKKQVDNFPKNIPSFFNGIIQLDTNFQYIYDFYKDLIGAFNELADSLNRAYTICCPDPTAFPKHILRGGLAVKTNTIKHEFYASPIHDHGNSVESLQLMFERILEMILNFNVSGKDEIRVTPSKHNHFALGERALPFYYDLDNSSDPDVMNNAWKLNNKWLLPNYYRLGYPQFFGDPLDYCLDGHDFFRVEGHVGRNVISAVSDITNIRNQKGLGFDIMPIAVGASALEQTIDYDKYRIYFEDLQIILQAWNEEIKCIVSGSSQFLSNFSILNQGQHLGYAVKNVAGSREGNAPERARAKNLADVTDTTSRLAIQNYQSYGNYGGQDKVNNVIENISSTEGSTGYYWNDQIAVEDNQNDIRIKLQDAVQDEIADWIRDYQVGSVEIPTEVLGALKDMEDNKLLDIEEFTETNLENFIASLQNLCDTGKQAKLTLQTYVSQENSLLKNQIYLEQYYFVLNNIISTCCMIERFRVLYEEILKRKKLLLDSLVLKEFIKKHPSAEHKAGVPEGGTLILLYYSKVRPNNQVLDEVVANEVIDNKVIVNQSGDIQKLLEGINKLAKDAQELKKMQEKVAGDAIIGNQFNDILNINDRFGGSQSLIDDILNPRGSVLSDGTVIGDLCIPYICCGQTPATTFVFPDRETDLFVSKEFVCKLPDTDADLVSITPTPSDGDVVAYVDGNVISDAIQVINKKYFFDPNVVQTSNYNKEITFTVDGQNVLPVLTIYQKPEPEFSFSGPIFSNQNNRASISIKNLSTVIDGQVFAWDFEVDQFENGLTDFDFNFDVQPGEDYIFTLKLTATNQRCSDTFQLPLEFTVPSNEEPVVGLRIEEDHICQIPRDEAALIPIFPSPENAQIRAFVDNVEVEENIIVTGEDLFLDPNEFRPEHWNKIVRFTVNNLRVEATFIINTRPEPAFEVGDAPKLSNNNSTLEINIINNSTPIEGQKFDWEIEETLFENNEPNFIHQFDVTPGSVFSTILKMTAVNNLCSVPATDLPFTFPIPGVDDGNNGNDLTCNDITFEKVKAGNIRLKKFAEINVNGIGGFMEIYLNEVVPMHQLIENQFASVMQGDHDTVIRNHIIAIQNEVATKFGTLQENIPKEWYLRLYLETMLIFFYIQACRKAPINAFTKITGGWIPFINSVVEKEPSLVQELILTHPYQDMLQELQTDLNTFLSSTMKKLLTTIINALNSTIG